MTPPHSQTVLAGIALVILGGIGCALVFQAVPSGNQQLLTFILGGLAGAITVGGANKVADTIRTTGPASGVNAPVIDGDA